jgi:hypothetical protein
MPRGRPKKIIMQKEFESLCGIMCTQDEICDVLDVSDKTLNAWCQEVYGENFSDIYKKKTSEGKSSLRRSQFRLAEKSAAMAIWLGKQYLNQSDNAQAEEASAKTIDALIEAVKNID